jgi:hypothetical protein
VAASQLGLTGRAQPIFFPNLRKTSIELFLEAQQHKKYAQTTPLDDGVSSLLQLYWFLISNISGRTETILKVKYVICGFYKA